RHLNHGKFWAGKRAEHVGESDGGAGDGVGKFLRVAAGFARGVDGDVDTFGLLGIELEISGDEGAVRSGRIALEGVDEAIAFGGVFAGSRRWCRGFAGACYSEIIGNVETEGGGVAVRGIVGEREPARGEKKVGGIASDGSGADSVHGAVLFVGERAGVAEGEGEFGSHGEWRRKIDDEIQRILRVALGAERLAVRGFDVADAKVGVKL